MRGRWEGTIIMDTAIGQFIEFSGRLDAAVKNADRIGKKTGLSGMTSASNRMRQTLDELSIEARETPDGDGIGYEQACETAERLYRTLLERANENHMLIRLAQTMNRVWADLTLSEGLDPTERITAADRLPDSR